MKIDAICVDKSGTQAEVTVDLDYVSDADALRHWIDEELYGWSMEHKKSFDTSDFVVLNWDDVVKEMEDWYGTCN